MNKRVFLYFVLLIQAYCYTQKIRPFYGPFPEPVPNKRMLFYLQRTIDRNTLIYEINYEAGNQVNEKKPVSVYWIDFEEGAKKSSLTFAQSKFAYGVEHELIDKIRRIYEISLVSYKKIKIILKQDRENNYKAHVMIKGRPAVLTRILVNISGGTYLKPSVSYVELFGEDLRTGAKLSEKFRPETN